MRTVAKPTWLPWFENKRGNDSKIYFYPFKFWTCKRDKPRENEAKTRRNRGKHGQKKGISHTLDIIS